MARSVKPTTCFGALTSNPYHKAPRQETRPTTGDQNKWRTFRKPRYRQPSLLHPTASKSPYVAGKAQGNLWMPPPPTARQFCPPRLPQDRLTAIPTTCWRCGPDALATTWPILQPLARQKHTPTAHATPEQQLWLHTHFEPAPAGTLATVIWQLNTQAEWRVHRGAFRTRHPALTYPVLAKHRSKTPEAPAYPTKQRCLKQNARNTNH